MDTVKPNRTSKLLIILAVLWTTLASQHVLSNDRLSQEEIKEISANWVCKWCPYPDKAESRTEVTAGAGYISNDSYKHGDYTGLNEKGPYLIGDVDYKYRAPKQTSINVSGSELGTDARDILVTGSSRGKIAGQLNYSELPKLNLDTARTPYNGDTIQQLPASWTTAGTTQAMPQLASALHNVDVYTKRKTFSLAASFQQDSTLSYELGFQRSTKDGSRTTGMALGNSFAMARSAILVIPVDYVTDQGEVKVNYGINNWHAAIAYQFSNFENRDKFIQWENAFSAPAATSAGQAALEPDNTMHKIVLTGAYRVSSSTSANGSFSYGQMKQDESFLPYTINGTLAPFALPTNSLDGKINTINASINLHTALTDKIQLDAKLFHNEQDNDTSRNSYDYVIADTVQSGTARANIPYSFRKVQYRIQGSYKVPQHQATLGVDHEEFDRTYQEVDTTTENTLNASYRTDTFKHIDFQLSGQHSKRDGDKYQLVTEILPPENSLLRKYNLADRNRNELGISINYNPETNWQLSFYVDASKDDYTNSDIGLLESVQKDYSIAYQHQISKTLLFHADYTMTRIESTQAGSQSFSIPTWRAVNKDNIDVLHVSVNYDVIPETLSIGVEYGYVISDGDIKVSTGGPLPDLKSERHTIMFHGDYHLSDNSTIIGFYRYEDYKENDWAIDDVNPDTINNVLTLGETSPSYSIGIIGVAIRHIF